MMRNPVLENIDAEEFAILKIRDFLSDNLYEGVDITGGVTVATEIPEDYEADSKLIIVQKITDNRTNSGWMRQNSVGFNCWSDTWSNAERLASRTAALLESKHFVQPPVYSSTTTTGVIKAGSLVEETAKVYYFAIQFKSKNIIL